MPSGEILWEVGLKYVVNPVIIWFLKSLRDEVRRLGNLFAEMKTQTEAKLHNLEERLAVLERGRA